MPRASQGRTKALLKPRPSDPPLPQCQRITQDQPCLIQVIAEVRADRRISNLDPKILQLTALHHVADIGVALPLFPRVTARYLHIVAIDVTGHEGEAWNAQCGEVVVIAHLP